MRAELVMYAGQAFDVASAMSMSDARSLLDSKTMEGWKKARDNQTAIFIGINNRLDSLIRAR